LPSSLTVNSFGYCYICSVIPGLIPLFGRHVRPRYNCLCMMRDNNKTVEAHLIAKWGCPSFAQLPIFRLPRPQRHCKESMTGRLCKSVTIGACLVFIVMSASSSLLYAMPTTMPMTMLSSSSTSWVSLPCIAALGGAFTLLM